jgi:hypothetical protein
MHTRYWYNTEGRKWVGSLHTAGKFLPSRGATATPKSYTLIHLR